MTDGQSASRILEMTASSPRRQPADVRREQILDAAEEVMLRDGLHGATMADIADVAGLGKGTIYLQFESKQDLGAGLRRRYLERIEQEVRSAVAAPSTTPEKLAAFVRSFVSASTRNPELHHVLFQEAGVDEADAFAPLRALFAEIVKGSDVGSANLNVAIDFAFGGIHSALVGIVHTNPARRSRATSQIAELVSRTLSA